jgi:hypothetical protein
MSKKKTRVKKTVLKRKRKVATVRDLYAGPTPSLHKGFEVFAQFESPTGLTAQSAKPIIWYFAVNSGGKTLIIRVPEQTWSKAKGVAWTVSDSEPISLGIDLR